MRITLNGIEQQVDEGTTVADLVDDVAGRSDRKGVAVARNGEVVRRSEWDEITVQGGDRLEILNAVQGG